MSNLLARHLSVSVSTGDIRYVGPEGWTFTVNELYSALMGLADRPTPESGEDGLDIASPIPARDITPELIELIPPYNIDDGLASMLYGGSITQAGALYVGASAQRSLDAMREKEIGETCGKRDCTNVVRRGQLCDPCRGIKPEPSAPPIDRLERVRGIEPEPNVQSITASGLRPGDRITYTQDIGDVMVRVRQGEPTPIIPFESHAETLSLGNRATASTVTIGNAAGRSAIRTTDADITTASIRTPDTQDDDGLAALSSLLDSLADMGLIAAPEPTGTEPQPAPGDISNGAQEYSMTVDRNGLSDTEVFEHVSRMVRRRQIDNRPPIPLANGAHLDPALDTRPKCPGCMGLGSVTMHPCSYNEDVNNDNSDSCNCCDKCSGRCADDI